MITKNDLPLKIGRRMCAAMATSPPRSDLPVLWMAMSSAPGEDYPRPLDEAALETLFHKVDDGDDADHTHLSVLLHAVARGGEGVLAFGPRHAARILRRVAARMDLPSGRFGPAERRLLAFAERAFTVLRPWFTPN